MTNHDIPLAEARIKMRNRIISTLQTGDLVKVKALCIPFIYHYGIVVRDGENFTVYHNDPDQKNHAGGNIICEDFMKWISDRDIVDVKYTGLAAGDIEAMVKELKSQKYDLVNFNCEHFITKIRNRKPSSEQVLNWAVGFATLITVIFIFKRKRR